MLKKVRLLTKIILKLLDQILAWNQIIMKKFLENDLKRKFNLEQHLNLK